MNLQDQYLRRAIYELYDSKCFYTGEPLDYINMELDHIIPRSAMNDLELINSIIKECSLPEDFHVDSLLNLVPTSRFNNRRKSDKQLDLKKIIYLFSFTSEKVDLINKKIIELKKKMNFEKHLSMLKTQFDEERNKQSRDNLLLNIFNFISDECDEFNNQDQVYYKENEQIYRKYLNKIGLEALMPRYNNPQTECVIYFKTLKARDCMFVLNNRTILSQLFKGLYTDPKHGTRGFLEYSQIDDKKTEEPVNLNNCKIALGNNRLKMAQEDIYSFCEIVDAYANEYFNQIKNIEIMLKTQNFPLSRRLNNYKLINVSYSNWRKMVEFANRHDIDNGRSKWNIFDRNGHYIKIYTKSSDRYQEGYHAFFNAEYSEDIVLHPSLTSKDVCITFEFIEDIDKRGDTGLINEQAHWNAEIANNWLINEFLPKALGKKKSQKIIKQDSRTKNLFSNSFKKITYINGKDVIDHNELKELVELIQFHFNVNPHNKYYVNKEDFQGIYNSILICISESKAIDLYYLCSKLNLADCKTPMELINSIKEISGVIQGTTINGFGIDFLFRALFSVIESCGTSLTMNEIQFIRNNINFFVIIRDREVLLDKYSIDFQ